MSRNRHNKKHKNTEPMEEHIDGIENEETQDEIQQGLQDKLAELNDKYLRLYSDFENYRKRTAKEKLDLIDSSNADLLLKLLPVVDDFERAIVPNENNNNPETLKEGFLLIFNKLANLMALEGVKPIEVLNEPFDVEQCEAITSIPVEDSGLKGKVIDVTEKGYFLKDKVLRYAKVVVGK